MRVVYALRVEVGRRLSFVHDTAGDQVVEDVSGGGSDGKNEWPTTVVYTQLHQELHQELHHHPNQLQFYLPPPNLPPLNLELWFVAVLPIIICACESLICAY